MEKIGCPVILDAPVIMMMKLEKCHVIKLTEME